MKVTKSHSFMGNTYIAADDPLLMRASCIEVEGQRHKRVVAYDIGNWFVIQGTYELIGKEIEIIE